MSDDAAAKQNQGFGPVVGPAAWYGHDLARRSEWIHRLSRPETDELLRLVAARRGVPREQIGVNDVPLDALAPAMHAWRETLRRGRGFVLVRGLPVDRMTDEDAALAYWILGLHLGTPAPQNFLGETLGGLSVQDRNEASLAAAVTSVMLGARIVRVHDTQGTVRAVRANSPCRARHPPR